MMILVYRQKLYAWTVKNVTKLHCEFSFHRDKVLAIDWKDELVFASASADGMVFLGQIGAKAPLKSFEGVTDLFGI